MCRSEAGRPGANNNDVKYHFTLSKLSVRSEGEF